MFVPTPKGVTAPKGLSDEKADRMMIALRSGQTLRLFAVKASRLEAYFKAHPDFALEARPLIEVNTNAAQCRKGARMRAKTHCNYGHLLSGDNLLRVNNGKWRRCRTCMKKCSEEGRLFNEDQARRVVAQLHEGRTIAEMTKAGSSTYVVNHRALLLFRRKQPKFDRLVLRLSAANAKIHYAAEYLRRRTSHRAKLDARAADVFAMIRAAVPANFPRDAREEIIASMALAIIEGRLWQRDIGQRVGEFIKAHYRMFSNFGPLSLDARLYDDGATTLGDTISRGLWD
jgi:hypothetical protein